MKGAEVSCFEEEGVKEVGMDEPRYIRRSRRTTSNPSPSTSELAEEEAEAEAEAE
jgi:hypothetical protein